MDFMVLEKYAENAKELNSFSKYKSGSATLEYNNMISGLDEKASKIEKKYQNQISLKIENFKKKCFDYLIDYYKNECSCPSVLICGAGNFPTAKKARQNGKRKSLNNTYNELVAEKEKIMKFQPKLDPNDEENKTSKEIEKYKAYQASMKNANAFYRKNHSLEGFNEITKNEALKNIAFKIQNNWYIQNGKYNEKTKEYWQFTLPFAGYELTSINLKIKRLEENLKKCKEKQINISNDPTGEKEKAEYSGVKILGNNEIDRLQIIFEEIPTEEIRTALKQHGFKWSPKNSAWQRQLTDNAKRDFKWYILPMLEKTNA